MSRKVRSFLYTYEVMWGSGDISSLNFNLGTRWCVVRYTSLRGKAFSVPIEGKAMKWESEILTVRLAKMGCS